MRFGAYEVTREEIIAFAGEFDPQPFHLDEEAANASLLKGLAASGWHTCSMAMRMTCDGYLNGAAGLGAPGIDEIRWLKPVRPGMTLGMVIRFVAARVSRSRPDTGLATLELDLHDEAGTILMTQRYTCMFARRSSDLPVDDPAAPQIARPAPLPDPPDANGADNASRFATWFDDVVIGARMALGAFEFRHDDMIRFARAYDPQPFHLSDEAAAKTHFGRLAASGWHTAAAYMKCYVATRDRLRAEARARGEILASTGPSPGIRDLRWLRPVFAGDVISYETKVIDKRPHRRPGWGVVTSRAHGTNQDGARVYEACGSVLLPLRA